MMRRRLAPAVCAPCAATFGFRCVSTSSSPTGNETPATTVVNTTTTPSTIAVPTGTLAAATLPIPPTTPTIFTSSSSSVAVDEDKSYDQEMLDKFLKLDVSLGGKKKSEKVKNEAAPDPRAAEPKWDDSNLNLDRPVDINAHVGSELTSGVLPLGSQAEEARREAESGQFTHSPTYTTGFGATVVDGKKLAQISPHSKAANGAIFDHTMKGAHVDEAAELLKYMETKKTLAKGVEDESFSVSYENDTKRLKFWWEKDVRKNSRRKVINKASANAKLGKVEKKISYQEFEDFKNVKTIRESYMDIDRELANLPRTMFDDGHTLDALHIKDEETVIAEREAKRAAQEEMRRAAEQEEKPVLWEEDESPRPEIVAGADDDGDATKEVGRSRFASSASKVTTSNLKPKIKPFVNVDGDEIYEGEIEDIVAVKEKKEAMTLTPEDTQLQESGGRRAVRSLMGNFFAQKSAQQKKQDVRQVDLSSEGMSRKEFNFKKGRLEAQRIREQNGRVLTTMETTNVSSLEVDAFKTSLARQKAKVPYRE